MLVALDGSSNRVVAHYDVRGGDFYCPQCAERVILKAGEIVAPHFAHAPGALCDYASGESARHLEMKTQVARLFARMDPQYEVRFGVERRADVIVSRTVIECQASPLSTKEWNERTRFYNKRGYGVLWVWDSGMLSKLWPSLGLWPEIRIPVVIRECHDLSWQRIYVLDQQGTIWSCHLFPPKARSSAQWGDYTPQTMCLPRFHRTALHLRSFYSDKNHRLVGLSEGAWWTEDGPWLEGVAA